ncbi:MAG TPA: hypothetical protein VF520_11275 [Thermoleophilaceae bacterium]
MRHAARGWGTTPDERAAPLPCDAVLPGAPAVDRAVDVDAPPAATFRWLCQLRAAPYSYDWIDNRGRRSPRELTPGLEHLEVGQRFMTIFRLVSFEPDEQITLRSRHVAVTYRVAPGRLHMRIRSRVWLPLLALPDLVMARRQLLTLAELAERDVSELARRAPSASAAGRPPPGSRAPSARGRA